MPITNMQFVLNVLHDWCNKDRGMCYPLWNDAYKRTFAANGKE